jgi:hypothetical protein
MKKMKIERLFDAMSDDSLREVLSYLGLRYLYLAPVSKRFCRLYARVHGNKRSAAFSASIESIPCVDWADKTARTYSLYDGRDACNIAARYGRLDIVQYAIEKGCTPSSDACDNAAEGGHLHILQWLRAFG